MDRLGRRSQAAAASDGVIHLAFRHHPPFLGSMEGAAAIDRRLIEAFGEALAGSDRPLVIASGTLGLAPRRLATELEGPGPGSPPIGGGATRSANAEMTLALAARGVRPSVVRLAPSVHDDGDHGFMATLVRVARDKGVCPPASATGPTDAGGAPGLTPQACSF